MEDRTVFEIVEGYYVPDGFFDPGYFVDASMVGWADSHQVAEKRAEKLRKDDESAYEVFENDYQPEFHTLEDFIKDESEAA
jgi:hypothetical protein